MQPSNLPSIRDILRKILASIPVRCGSGPSLDSMYLDLEVLTETLRFIRKIAVTGGFKGLAFLNALFTMILTQIQHYWATKLTRGPRYRVTLTLLVRSIVYWFIKFSFQLSGSWFEMSQTTSRISVTQYITPWGLQPCFPEIKAA